MDDDFHPTISFGNIIFTNMELITLESGHALRGLSLVRTHPQAMKFFAVKIDSVERFKGDENFRREIFSEALKNVKRSYRDGGIYL